MKSTRLTAIEELYEPVQVVAVTVVGPVDLELLAESEYDVVRAASPDRQQEFAAGRIAARSALEHLGMDAPPLVRATRRAPSWPIGVYGSIAHTKRRAIAVVTNGSAAVGVDIERIGRVSKRVRERVCTRSERDWLEAHPLDDQPALASKVFGAKEAFFKAQYQLTDTFVGFDDMTCELVDDNLVMYPASDLSALQTLMLPVTVKFLSVDDELIAAVSVRNYPAQNPIKP